MKYTPLILRSSGSLTVKLSKKTPTRKLKRSVCSQTKKSKGLFSLHITNVLERDVGKYMCIAYVANFGKPHVAEAIIQLKLYESGKSTLSEGKGFFFSAQQC